jgi:hypothetical protein
MTGAPAVSEGRVTGGQLALRFTNVAQLRAKRVRYNGASERKGSSTHARAEPSRLALMDLAIGERLR